MAEEGAFPHLLPGRTAGGRWTVLECAPSLAHTQPWDRSLSVPRASTTEDVLVRLHELRHIVRYNAHGWRPGHQPWRDLWRLMLEEVALEAETLAEGLDLRRARDGFDYSTLSLPTLGWQAALDWLQHASSAGATRNPLIVERVATCCSMLLQDREGWRMLQRALAEVSRTPDHATCEVWADTLAAHFAPPPPPTPTSRTREGQEAAAAAAQEAQEAAAAQEAQERAAGEADQTAEVRTVRTSAGALDVHVHVLARQAGRTVGVGWRSTTAGGVLRRPAQLWSTGRMFAVPGQGGSLLVDVSGSMAWTQSTLENGVAALPRLWAGAYSGHGTSTQYCGRLCVIASGGRVADLPPEPERSDVNYQTGADLASLEYLARQSGPRVWVSDGSVGSDYDDRCTAVMRATGIVRVRTMQHGIEYLLGHAVPGWVTCDEYTLPRMLARGSR